MKKCNVPRTVLISGASGFIGMRLMKTLKQHGYTVYGIARHGDKHTNIIPADICNASAIRQIFRHIKPDIYVHLAGVSTAEEGSADVIKTSHESLCGALIALEACRTFHVKRTLFGSSSHSGLTDALYQGRKTGKLASYDSIKVATELIVRAYAEQYHLPIAIARFVNIYGGGDLHLTRVIPSIIQQAIKNGNVVLWGNGLISREFLYIDDAVQGAITLMKYPLFPTVHSQIFSFGTGKLVTIKKMAHMIVNIINPEIPVHFTGRSQRDEVRCLITEANDTNNLLGWHSTTPLTRGLQHTITWYKNYFSGSVGPGAT